MSEKLPQKRRYARIETDALVDYTGSEVLLFHKIENISLGGLSIKAPNVEEVGTQVYLVINFPELGTSIETEGEVVWARTQEPKEMGIKFTSLTDEQREILKKYLDMKMKQKQEKLEKKE